MKKLMLICAPLTSRSGYGDHARDLFYAFNRSGKYDIKVIDVRWGECPRDALNPNSEKDKQILNCILPMPPQMDRQPDIYVDIRIPQEFETFGKFNIGITAGVETTAVSNKWIEGCNRMDLVIVPSEHSKDGFVKTIYDKIQQLPDGRQQKVGEHKLEKPIEVLFEGVDEEIFKPLNIDKISDSFLSKMDKTISEKFAFLHVGQWTKGGYGEDRKDIGKLIKVFYESFANKKKQPALILKTSGATFSIIDKEDILTKIKEIKSMFPSDWKLPNVYLLHGNMTREELNNLYNYPKVKAMVSFTHGEGFGRPLLEATMTGLPVVASEWSGQLDFLDNEKSILITGNLEKIPKSIVWKDILIEESQWFSVNESKAYSSLNYVFENQGEVKRKGESLMYKNREKFTLDKMADKLDEIMKKHISDIPSQVGLKLPKLKKVKSDEKPKIKLPKLKKVG
jgi:glycosyltransferase involved in cell wall biosynthesis